MDNTLGTKRRYVSPVLGLVDSAGVGRSAAVRAFAGVLGGCLLITLGAHIRVPIPGTEVPMTLQLLAVLVIGFVFPPTHAVVGTLLYVTCGVFGFPVFAPGSMGLAGPTGGYIVGFVVAVWLLGYVRGGRDAGTCRLLTVGAAAAATVLLCGVAWRAAWLGGDVLLNLTTGLVPFVPKAIVEVLLAVSVIRVMWRLAPDP